MNITNTSDHTINKSSICGADNMHLDLFGGCHTNYHRHIPKYALVTLLLTTALLALIGNTLTMIVISKVRRMHTVMNYLIFNLTVADLIASLFCLCVDVPIEVHERWIFGGAMCNVLLPLRALSILASIFTLTVLSLTRCWAVVYPFRSQPTVSTAKLSIASIWTVSCALVVPYMSVLAYDEDIPYKLKFNN